MKIRIFLTLFFISVVAPVSAEERLVYAFKKHGITTIFSCKVDTLRCVELYSDAETRMKLMRRGGAFDSVRVIRTVGNWAFAVGTTDSSKVGAIYELYLDGSNRSRKIAEIQSSAKIDRMAVDQKGKMIAYPSLIPDTSYKGDGEQHFIPKIVVHDVTTGQVTEQIDVFERTRTSLVTYLAWGRSNDNLYIRIEGRDEKKEGLFRVGKNSSFSRLPNPLKGLKTIAGQLLNDEFLIEIYAKTNKLLIEDDKGKIQQEISLEHSGWHYELSSDDRFLAIQTSNNEIWIKDLKSRKEKLLLKMDLDYFKEQLSLIGWINSAS